MRERSIVVIPDVNPYPLDETGYSARVETVDHVRQVLEKHAITPATHGRVVDVAAGRGALARLFVDQGWSKHTVVCIDQHEPREPLVDVAEVEWHFWNVLLLADVLKQHPETVFEKEVESQRGRFDVVVLGQLQCTGEQKTALAAFFLSGSVQELMDGDVFLAAR